MCCRFPTSRYQFRLTNNEPYPDKGIYPNVCGSSQRQVLGTFPVDSSRSLNHMITRRAIGRSSAKLASVLNSDQKASETAMILGNRPYDGNFDNKGTCHSLKGGIGKMFNTRGIKNCQNEACGSCSKDVTSTLNTNVRFVVDSSDYLRVKSNKNTSRGFLYSTDRVSGGDPINLNSTEILNIGGTRGHASRARDRSRGGRRYC